MSLGTGKIGRVGCLMSEGGCGGDGCVGCSGMRLMGHVGW